MIDPDADIDRRYYFAARGIWAITVACMMLTPFGFRDLWPELRFWLVFVPVWLLYAAVSYPR